MDQALCKVLSTLLIQQLSTSSLRGRGCDSCRLKGSYRDRFQIKNLSKNQNKTGARVELQQDKQKGI